ncbi:MAG: ribulokinase [Bacteroidota bacterium]
MTKNAYVIGVDFGTDSVRSILVDSSNGVEISSSVFYYPKWKEGKFCNPSKNQFRQHPQDYIDGLQHTIKACVEAAGPEIALAVKAIGVDTTGSSPVAVDRKGQPLALLPAFAENPNAMFVLWKDHTSVAEAASINQHATKFPINYLQYVGGIYSSEWFWAKLLHILRVDETVRKACYTWVEHCDWIPFLLTGQNDATQLKRSVCAAGHKGLWSANFEGYPPNEFFSSLDPLLDEHVERLGKDVYTSDKSAGHLSDEWASTLGLPIETIVAVGAFDAHMGAVGGQIEPFHLSKVMGTSTCDMLVAPKEIIGDTLVKGICGQVDGSVIPGMIGLEAGQSAFGDSYAWLKKMVLTPVIDILSNTKITDEETITKLIDELSTQFISELSRKANELPLSLSDPIATDWLNGRRTPDANQLLKSGITGLNLSTDAVMLFKTIVESTCFGAKAIVDRFNEEGVPIKGLIGLGGVAKKSPYIMQVMSDVMNMPIRIHKSEQTCALGAAMFAATAAGEYDKVDDAMIAMGQGFDTTYFPNESNTEFYNQRMEQYKKLGAFLESNY